MISKCVQYGVWANCPNKCDFCLLRQKEFYTVEQQLFWLDQIENNIKQLDWANEFSGGISLLGGELYYVKNEKVKAKFLHLIDVIIEYILKVSKDPVCRYSTVTNGLYEPSFLFQVIDKIKDSVGMEKVDVNFSYDFKYRFKNEAAERLCASNIRAFRDRYNYKVGIQMILTQHVIDKWKAGEFDLHYDWGKDADASDMNKGVLYLLIFKLLNVLSPDRKWEKAIASVDALGSAIEKAKNQYKDTVREWGRKYKREKLIYTMGSGASYGEAYSFSICLLMEMQWINSSCIHTGEYFHGPFEITDYDVPFIIILGRGATRHLDERAYSFCRKYSDEIMLVDESTFDMSGIDEEVQPYFASILSGVVLRTLADELAYQRGHDLSVRRYMWRMEY